MVLGRRASVKLVVVGKRAGRLTSLEVSPGRLRAAITVFHLDRLCHDPETLKYENTKMRKHQNPETPIPDPLFVGLYYL
jgi:hypothetical protein